MARVDYYAIEQAIASQIKNYSGLSTAAVSVETPLEFQRGRIVIVYLDRRDAPDEMQVAAANTILRLRLTFSIWCWAFGMDVKGAVEERDDLLGQVELALMSDTTFSDAVDTSWISGGEFQTLQQDRHFMVGAEIVLIADKEARL